MVAEIRIYCNPEQQIAPEATVITRTFRSYLRSGKLKKIVSVRGEFRESETRDTTDDRSISNLCFRGRDRTNASVESQSWSILLAVVPPHVRVCDYF